MASTKALSTSGVQSSSTIKISTIRRGKSKKSYPPRKCNYCKGLFVPFQSHQKFCCENHQKLYWKYGTIPFEKLARRLELRFDAEVVPLRARVVELEESVQALSESANNRAETIAALIGAQGAVLKDLEKRLAELGRSVAA
jgi:hypothetical protein